MVLGQIPAPLGAVVENYEEFRGSSVELYGVDGLLLALGGFPNIYFDCTRGKTAPVPVYAQTDWTDPPEIVLGSIGDLALAMLHALDSGAWQVNEQGWIRCNADRMTDDLWFLA